MRYRQSRQLLKDFGRGRPGFHFVAEDILADADAAKEWKPSVDYLASAREHIEQHDAAVDLAVKNARSLARHINRFKIGHFVAETALQYLGFKLEPSATAVPAEFREKFEPSAEFPTIEALLAATQRLTQGGRLADVLERFARLLELSSSLNIKQNSPLQCIVGPLAYTHPLAAKDVKSKYVRVRGLLFGTVLRLRYFEMGRSIHSDELALMPSGRTPSRVLEIATTLALEALGYGKHGERAPDLLRKHLQKHPGIAFVGWPNGKQAD